MKLDTISCTAGHKTFSIDADGRIYSCDYYANNIKNSIGNINIKNEFSNSKFASKDVNNLKYCNSCYLKYLCAGACIAEKKYPHLVPNLFTCKIKKAFWNSVFSLYIELNEKNPEYLKKLKI